VTDASATLLWDVAADRWAHDVVTGVGLDPALLPVAREPDETAGAIGAEAAAAWGLPAGLPVSVGCSDVAATLLGAGAAADRSTLVVGTGAQVLRPGVRAADDPAPRSHTYRGVGTAYAMSAIQNAGLALDWVCRAMGASWAELYAAVPRAAAPHGSVDATGPVFLPYLSGERVPTPVGSGHGEWTGLGLDTDRGALLRAAAEGVAFAIREGLSVLPPAADPQIDVAGGGARTAQFQQLLADVLRSPVRPVDVPEATAAGAALLGWRAAGRPDVTPALRFGAVVEPRPGAAAAYDRLFERFLAAAPSRRGEPHV
jgi:xylulokinase